MTTKERNEIRAVVETEIANLRKSILTLIDLADSEVQSDANDWFSSKESNPSKEINELSLAKAKRTIVILTKVLSRIDSAEFGICIKCGKQIPTQRLKAVPTATRCVSC